VSVTPADPGDLPGVPGRGRPQRLAGVREADLDVGAGILGVTSRTELAALTADPA
jgi:hypothetical protein